MGRDHPTGGTTLFAAPRHQADECRGGLRFNGDMESTSTRPIRPNDANRPFRTPNSLYQFEMTPLMGLVTRIAGNRVGPDPGRIQFLAALGRFGGAVTGYRIRANPILNGPAITTNCVLCGYGPTRFSTARQLRQTASSLRAQPFISLGVFIIGTECPRDGLSYDAVFRLPYSIPLRWAPGIVATRPLQPGL